MDKTMPKSVLYSDNTQKVYSDECTEVAFLLGGIGTGNFSVGSRGQLQDWEIYGTSGKGNYMPNTFFAIRVKEEGKDAKSAVLESKLKPPFARSHGFVDHTVGGLPRFNKSTAKGEYPFFTVKLEDEAMPVEVEMESFTPFIPLNAADSGIPTAIIRYKVKNISTAPVSVAVAGSLANMSSLKSYSKRTWQFYEQADEGVNEYLDDGNIRGLLMHPKSLDNSSLYYGTLALTTSATPASVSHKRAWHNAGWWDGLQDFWTDFTADGKLEAEALYVEKDAVKYPGDLTGSLAVNEVIDAGETRTFEFQLSWHFPNRVDCWSTEMYDKSIRVLKPEEIDGLKESHCSCGNEGKTCEVLPEGEYPLVRKRYAVLHADAWAAAHYTHANLGRLEGDSRKFHDAFYGSTLPGYILEATANNITVMRSNTCFWLEDGKFMAWEGCFNDEGCCEGTCTHVWNYAQSIAFLFPELEQSMRRIEYKIETLPDGKMNFRSYQVWGMGAHGHVPAADGQLGTIVRLYREWKISGSDEFIKEMWPTAKKTLDYAFDYWDKDGDFVLDTQQFNTYDISFQGPSSMINSIFFAALRAGEEISKYLGDMDSAAMYRRAFEAGSRRMDELLWRGEYYAQKVGDLDEFRYQYGSGCLADQIFGQTLAHIAGLGHILPVDHVKQAIKSVFDNNYFLSFDKHSNPQRTYALNDEQGLVLCTWPQDGRPRIPFPYSDEVWTGIEYQVATTLIYEGFIDEGLTIVKSVRDRHDGVRRNPWNEVECGHHYARSLASYGVYLALCGFEYDMTRGFISFDPKINRGDFKCFFTAGNCWGIYSSAEKNGDRIENIEVLYGDASSIKGR